LTTGRGFHRTSGPILAATTVDAGQNKLYTGGFTLGSIDAGIRSFLDHPFNY
jgi:hypothetical protein